MCVNNIHVATWVPDRQGTIRLIGGPNNSSGRLEIFLGDSWGSVCNKGWSHSESLVACQELGFSGAVIAANYLSFGTGGGPIKVGSISCHGNETLLTDCTNSSDFSDCSHLTDVAVLCSSKLSDKLFFFSFWICFRPKPMC